MYWPFTPWIMDYFTCLSADLVFQRYVGLIAYEKWSLASKEYVYT